MTKSKGRRDRMSKAAWEEREQAYSVEEGDAPEVQAKTTSHSAH